MDSVLGPVLSLCLPGSGVASSFPYGVIGLKPSELPLAVRMGPKLHAWLRSAAGPGPPEARHKELF